MKRYLSFSTTFLLLFGIALFPLSHSRAQTTRTPAVNQGNEDLRRIHSEMTRHQKEMDNLLAKLQKDFETVVPSKDAYGYVHDKSAVRVYKADLEALRNAVREHKLLTADYKRWCGQLFTLDYRHWCSSKEDDAMVLHQQQMKAALYALFDTFDTYVKADDSSIEGSPEKIKDALDAHRNALKDFADAIHDHEQAVAQL